jgi:hypothetical protein
MTGKRGVSTSVDLTNKRGVGLKSLSDKSGWLMMSLPAAWLLVLK